MRQRPRWCATALGVLAASLGAAGPAVAADVPAGQSIQAAINAAQPGETITIAPGVFRENLTITKDAITLKGSGSGGAGTVLMPAPAPTPSVCTNPQDGEVMGICVVGQVNMETGAVGPPVNDTTIRDLTVDGFTGTGIFSLNADDLTIEDVRARNNKGYGIAGFMQSGISYLDSVAHDNGEPGFYIGDSPNAQAVVRGNTAIRNGVGGEGFGFLFRDASHGEVRDNKAFRNCLGFIVVDSGENPIGASDWTLRRNAANRNNAACPAGGEENLPAFSGTGILLAGTDATEVSKNHVVGNRPSIESPFSGGIVLSSGEPLGGAPLTNNLVTENVALFNEPADIVWDESGTGNRISRNHCRTSRPEGLCKDDRDDDHGRTPKP